MMPMLPSVKSIFKDSRHTLPLITQRIQAPDIFTET